MDKNNKDKNDSNNELDSILIFDYEFCEDKTKCTNRFVPYQEFYDKAKCISYDKYTKLKNTNSINKTHKIDNSKDCIDWCVKQKKKIIKMILLYLKKETLFQYYK